MLIVGCDYHPERAANCFGGHGHRRGERTAALPREQVEQFYRELKQRNVAVRVGMESSGHSRWFERLLRDLQFELWIGDAAEIRRYNSHTFSLSIGGMLLRGFLSFIDEALTMRPRTVILRSVKLSPWTGTVIAFLATLPFWLWRPIRDAYLPYSGIVMDEGMQYDVLSGEEDSYIVVEDPHGVRTKRFVSSLAHVRVGCFVVKQRGFQKSPRCVVRGQ